MKQKIFTLLIISAIGLLSCKKSKVEPDIKQYDQAQIMNYISVHGITGMKRDKTNGDTTGMYYQIINPGDSVDQGKPLPPMDYPDKIAFVFSLRSFDGKYAQVDTITNHYDGYLGHVTLSKLPIGLQLALRNNLRYRGASMRLLIPSHLAYGINGYGSGSITNTNNRIAGNQCLDYYVHVIGNTSTNNQATYDDLVIRNYMAANTLTGYTKTASGLYYKILTPGTGTVPITATSTNTGYYTGLLLNGNTFDSQTTNIYTFSVTSSLNAGLVPGVAEGLENYATVGTKLSLIMPSALGYGEVGYGSIPPNSCLMFSWQILTVTP